MFQDNKTGINSIIFIFLFVENCLKYDDIHDFLVLPRTSSYTSDINRFRSHAGKYILYALITLSGLLKRATK